MIVNLYIDAILERFPHLKIRYNRVDKGIVYILNARDVRIAAIRILGCEIILRYEFLGHPYPSNVFFQSTIRQLMLCKS